MVKKSRARVEIFGLHADAIKYYSCMCTKKRPNYRLGDKKDKEVQFRLLLTKVPGEKIFGRIKYARFIQVLSSETCLENVKKILMEEVPDWE